ncbi:hypothetical protein B0H13DRAFT_2685553 [Mycena leptocephala]|nr:hypothetical protein B0H13DRAFT_2685553 [Mycena leptocephala]
MSAALEDPRHTINYATSMVYEPSDLFRGPRITGGRRLFAGSPPLSPFFAGPPTRRSTLRSHYSRVTYGSFYFRFTRRTTRVSPTTPFFLPVHPPHYSRSPTAPFFPVHPPLACGSTWRSHYSAPIGVLALKHSGALALLALRLSAPSHGDAILLAFCTAPPPLDVALALLAVAYGSLFADPPAVAYGSFFPGPPAARTTRAAPIGVLVLKHSGALALLARRLSASSC